MSSNPRHSQSPSPSGHSVNSSTEIIEPDQMEWSEWQRYMNRIHSRGLNYFLNRYVVTKRIDINQFLVNLDITISILVDKSSSDQLDEINKIRCLVKLERSIIKFLRVRKKLSEYNTIDDAVSLIQRSNKILILTGAGISTSCGIPDFRSENGLYSQLGDYDGLDDPYDMFDLKFFKSNPEPFYKFLKTIFPFSSASTIASSSLHSNPIEPSDSHLFISLVESNSKLLRNYTQNIDTLEMRAGVQNLVQCHGSFAKFTCLKCKAEYPGSQFEDLITQAKVVFCPSCSASSLSQSSAEYQPRSKKRKKTNLGSANRALVNNDGNDDDDDQAETDWVSQGLMKPNITFFGEDLPIEFDKAIETDRFECDLLIVIGTSLKVAPVSEIIKFVPNHVPQILINRDPIYRGKNPSDTPDNHAMFEYVGDDFEFDIYLFGDSDLILRELSFRLGKGWELPNRSVGSRVQNHYSTNHQVENIDRQEKKILFSQFNQRINHIWLFPGSNSNHSWFDQWQTMGNRNDDRDPTSPESESEPERVQSEASPSSKKDTN